MYVCMYVCVCVCVCVCVYRVAATEARQAIHAEGQNIYMCIYLYVYTNVYIYIYIYIYKNIFYSKRTYSIVREHIL